MHTLQSVRYAIFKVLWYYWIDLPSESESKSGSKMDILQLDHYVCVCVCVYIYIYPNLSQHHQLHLPKGRLVIFDMSLCGVLFMQKLRSSVENPELTNVLPLSQEYIRI